MLTKEAIVTIAKNLIVTHTLPNESIKYVENALSVDYHPHDFSDIEIHSCIDHTNLTFDATSSVIETLCDDAYTQGFGAVCVNPVWVRSAFARRNTLNASYKIASVIDFPLGASSLSARREEAKDALKNGADELDIVLSIGLLKTKYYRAVYDLLRVAIESGGFAKVILEMSSLTYEEKIHAALLAVMAGADMLKTSTGVNGKASMEDVALLRTVACGTLGVKAAGGIRTLNTVKDMIAAGADRIGASASLDIMNELLFQK